MAAPKKRKGITQVRRSDGSIAHRAEAYDKVTKRRKCMTFDSVAAAETWRADMQTKLRTGQARAVRTVKLANVAEQWSVGVGLGVIRARGGQPYKPSVLRGYASSFAAVWLPKLGHVSVAELRTKHVQDVVDALVAGGAAAQTVRNHATALRSVLNWAVRQEYCVTNPCVAVALPSGGTVRDRIASPSEALQLVQAIPGKQDRALWATAFFAGLRRGELQALRWEDVDLAKQTITVHPERGNYDDGGRRFVAPKSKAGARTLSFPAVLLGFLTQLDGTEGLVFPGPRGNPFKPTDVAAWATEAWSAAGLNRITLHECRHTYASIMIAAGCNIKTIQTWMGHSSVTVTLDRYGHLLPGSAAVALGLLETYLEGELA